MSSDEFLFQVVITEPDGSKRSVPLTHKLMNIGSRDGQDIQLQDLSIDPTHARILLKSGSTDSVLFIDLANAGSPPRHWQVGEVIAIGDYQLRLELAAVPEPVTENQPIISMPNGNGHSKAPQEFLREMIRGEALSRPSARPSRIMEANQPTVVDSQPEMIDQADPTTEHMLPIANPALIERGDSAPILPLLPEDEMLQDAQSSDEVFLPAVIPARDVLFSADDDDWHTQPYTPALQQLDEEFDPDTQPKDWTVHANLGAQVTLNPIKAVAGERVRVPLSLRNGNRFAMDVRVTLTGLPGNWTILSPPHIHLNPHETSLNNLVIQTQPTTQETLEALVHIKDLSTASISTHVLLQFALRQDADLVGQLEPAQPKDSDPVYLHLQNHTRSAVTVFLNGGSNSDDLQLGLTENNLRIPPGQSARVAVQFVVKRRPVLRTTQCTFWISAQQGTRAPLDYPGSVRIQPLLGVILLLVIALISAIVLVAFLTSIFN